MRGSSILEDTIAEHGHLNLITSQSGFVTIPGSESLQRYFPT
jgi:hypothetical protein